MKSCKYWLFLLIQLISIKVFGQVDYYRKLELITINSIKATQLFQRLDSLKQTLRPSDSHVIITFDRDIDFGYKHQRMDIELNGAYYHINILAKANSIVTKSVLYGNSTFLDSYSESYNKRHACFYADTNQVYGYLKLRNDFYSSFKSLDDLKNELNIATIYAFRCGDGLQKTGYGKYIEELVNKRNITEIEKLLNSICCEEQAYGSEAFFMLKKKRYKIPMHTQKILSHVKKRKSTLVQCVGCFVVIR
jgi:hypothetical protein